MSVERKIGSRKQLYLAVFSANILYLSTGSALTWTSPVLPKLQNAHILTEYQGYWVGSMVALGAILGPSLNAVGIDNVGRKGTLLLNMTTFLISWIILGVSFNFYVMCIGRFIAGIAVGCTFNSISVYNTEVADDAVRQAVTSAPEFFLAIGYLIQYCIGPFVSYTWLVVVSAIATGIFGCIFIFFPESPYYLLAKGKRQQAIKALCWFRGNVSEESVEDELKQIQETIDESHRNSGKSLDLIRKPGPRKALLITLYILFIQQVSGIDVMTSYTEPIFAKAHNPLIPPSIGAMLVGLTVLISSTTAPLLVKRFGLKSILISAGVASGISMLIFALYFYLDECKYAIVSQLSWLPITSLILYNIFFCIGVGPLPFVVAAELFPPSLKGLALNVTSSFAWLFAFLVMDLYGVLLDITGVWPIFTFYGLCLTFGMIACWWILPDTSGMSFQEIQDKLSRKNIETKKNEIN